MSSSNENNRWKLSDTQIAELSDLYVNQGWRVNRIARHFEIHFSSVLYWIKQLALERAVPVVTKQEVKRVFLASTRHRNYQTYVKEDREKFKKTCLHDHWIKRCSCCGKILESDSSHLIAEHGLIADAPVRESVSLIKIIL